MSLKLMNHIVGILFSVLFMGLVIKSPDKALSVVILVNFVLVGLIVYGMYIMNKLQKTMKQISELVWIRFILVLLVHFISYGLIIFGYTFFAGIQVDYTFFVFFVTNLIITYIVLNNFATNTYFHLLSVCCTHRYGMPTGSEHATKSLMKFILTYENNFVKRYLNGINVPEEEKLLGYFYETIPSFYKNKEKEMISKMKTLKKDMDENNIPY